MSRDEDHTEQPGFAIFRARDAKPDTEAEVMTYLPFGPEAADGLQRVSEAGYDHGHDLKVLFSAPGFSLIYVWFKSEFPLPRHSHDADCLYYIVGGSIRLGHEELGVGDGFFVGRDVPYTYQAGPQGVELLEFRTSNAFHFRNLARSHAFWDAAARTVAERKEAWLEEPRPTKRPGA